MRVLGKSEYPNSTQVDESCSNLTESTPTVPDSTDNPSKSSNNKSSNTKSTNNNPWENLSIGGKIGTIIGPILLLFVFVVIVRILMRRKPAPEPINTSPAEVIGYEITPIYGRQV
ncbi:9166_t:CDS:2 [Acaulospora morrowiae]|uniref:9166_t:CDS:1 n=1 Tax=Acaulospora morrowiae TaxID=94023 RepID=A0A9N9BVV1_9GLOM|nr:9166_t:CDS:2 [Acaulospora morrowiae]